jgi:ferredoxin
MPRRKLRLKVDPIRCTAFGFCAEFLPEAFALDDWGYAWLQRDELTPEFEAHAREVVRLCPTGAISLEVFEEETPPAATGVRRDSIRLMPTRSPVQRPQPTPLDRSRRDA